MSASIIVKGIPKAIKYLQQKEKNVKGSVKRAMNLVGIHVQGEIKSSIVGQREETKSFVTGTFMRSVDFKASPEEVVVFSKIPYAGRLEYGTDFKNSPRKHFRNSVDREKPKVKQIIQNELRNI